MYKICVVGGPSSGKTERGKRVAQFLGYQYQEMSGILKEQNDPEVDRAMSECLLVPDEKSIPAFLSVINQEGFREKFSSGFPRNTAQARCLWLHLSAKCASGSLVVFDIVRTKKDCQRLSNLRKRSDDALFETRWAQYEHEHKALVAFLKSKLGSRFIEVYPTEDISADVVSMKEAFYRVTATSVPRRRKIKPLAGQFL